VTRRIAETNGRLAEYFAAILLQFGGYVILGRRVKTKRGEIDLIAKRGKVLAFIEVKMRKKFVETGEILRATQMSRIVAAATGWASARAWAKNCIWRYDVLIIYPWRWPVHIRDAWRPQYDPTLERASRRNHVSGVKQKQT
jgi:putative endonuclease